jgi:hypothetical protein
MDSSSHANARHPLASDSGGITFENAESHTKLIMAVLKELGKKFLQGNFKDLMKISRPAIISYPKTYLQAIATDFGGTYLLERAAAETDPVVRLEIMASFIVSGMHRNIAECQTKAPLNPILGETYVGTKENGTTIYID